ncbi:alpha/beta hydrolase [Flavobacterium psychrophilum]|uniref:alpha/beta hydrolase n=1 Tax=Flavobacterium psychrophilum TaxID=96345 RepID=UPI001C8FA244|nr:alpha/beta hydrolase [Flavobacterium psychrophilum]QZK99425.1 alpha/beta hydrolase [Flavobacterium psychrophilum]
MKKLKYILLFILSLNLIISCGKSKKEIEKKTEKKNYIFFLHNKFVEENDIEVEHPEYGKAEYSEIIKEFEKDDFIVLSEKRKKNTDTELYAEKIVSQIDSLLKIGVKANHISVIGTSKGGYIAQYVSTIIANPNLNFVFIGCFQESDIENYPEINYCGNILTIYEKSDFYGVSAIKRKMTSKLKINKFKEVELNTNLKHGFLFKPLKEWIEPSKMWAKRNYKFEINKKPNG